MNNSVIYYFSGTGNSLFVANLLAKRLNAKLIPIISILNKKNIEINAETIGLVFPLHGMTTPIPVKNFLKKAHFINPNYIFAVTTRSGSKSHAFERINKLLAKKEMKLNLSFIFDMCSNDPKFDYYKVPTPEEIQLKETGVVNQLDFICNKICCKEDYHFDDKTGITFSNNKIINTIFKEIVMLGMNYAEHGGANNYFYADNKCKGCIVCEEVCLANRIKIIDNKPIWLKDIKCYLCYACLNYCPTHAIQIKTKWYMKSYTKDKGRYPHPYATFKEIALQKESY